MQVCTVNHLWASHMKWHALFIEVDCDVSLLCVIVLFGAREAGCFREVAVLYSDGFDSTYTDWYSWAFLLPCSRSVAWCSIRNMRLKETGFRQFQSYLFSILYRHIDIYVYMSIHRDTLGLQLLTVDWSLGVCYICWLDWVSAERITKSISPDRPTFVHIETATLNTSWCSLENFCISALQKQMLHTYIAQARGARRGRQESTWRLAHKGACKGRQGSMQRQAREHGEADRGALLFVVQ